MANSSLAPFGGPELINSVDNRKVVKIDFVISNRVS